MNKFKIEIPNITNDTVKVFVNDKFIGNGTFEQTSKMRVDIVKYINETGDESILDTFYFVGHRDDNDKMGEEIKITMDKIGNISDSPWEFNHIRRCMWNLIMMERDNQNK